MNCSGEVIVSLMRHMARSASSYVDSPVAAEGMLCGISIIWLTLEQTPFVDVNDKRDALLTATGVVLSCRNEASREDEAPNIAVTFCRHWRGPWIKEDWASYTQRAEVFVDTIRNVVLGALVSKSEGPSFQSDSALFSESCRLNRDYCVTVLQHLCELGSNLFKPDFAYGAMIATAAFILSVDHDLNWNEALACANDVWLARSSWPQPNEWRGATRDADGAISLEDSSWETVTGGAKRLIGALESAQAAHAPGPLWQFMPARQPVGDVDSRGIVKECNICLWMSEICNSPRSFIDSAVGAQGILLGAAACALAGFDVETSNPFVRRQSVQVGSQRACELWNSAFSSHAKASGVEIRPIARGRRDLQAASWHDLERVGHRFVNNVRMEHGLIAHGDQGGEMPDENDAKSRTVQLRQGLDAFGSFQVSNAGRTWLLPPIEFGMKLGVACAACISDGPSSGERIYKSMIAAMEREILTKEEQVQLNKRRSGTTASSLCEAWMCESPWPIEMLLRRYLE